MTGPSETNRAAVMRIARLLRMHGGRTLLVGGCVRDALMGTPGKDYDLEVYGLNAEAVRRIVGAEYALDPVGMSFGVFKLHHLEIDIALPRRENKTGSGHRGFMVSAIPDLDYAEAAARRDFTVNAIMQDPLTGEILDPWHGREDLKRGVLRHVSEHFSEDPLRVLRGMQFAARFGFSVAPETVRLCISIRQEELPMERLGTEWEKMLLKGARPSIGLQFLQDTDWLRYYPELAALAAADWAHTLEAMDAAAKLRTGEDTDDLLLMTGTLCARFPDAAKTFLGRLWRRNDLFSLVPPLVRALQQMPEWLAGPISDSAMRRLALAVKRLDLLLLMAAADGAGTVHERTAFRDRADRLNIFHAPPEPLILGRDLLERGMRPGPAMGTCLKQCFDAQLDGVFSDRSGALGFLESRRPGDGAPRHK